MSVLTAHLPRLGSLRWANGSTTARTLETCWGDEFVESEKRENPLGKGENLLDYGLPGEEHGQRKWGHERKLGRCTPVLEVTLGGCHFRSMAR